MTKIKIGLLQVNAENLVNFFPTTDGQPIVEVDSLLVQSAREGTGSMVQFRNAQADGVQYKVYAKSATLEYIDVKDCVAAGPGVPFHNSYGVDSGNNQNWQFGTTAPGIKGYNAPSPQSNPYPITNSKPKII